MHPRPPQFALALALTAGAAFAQAPIQQCPPSQTIPLTVTGWQLPVSFPRFDPALGLLQRVEFQLAAQVEVAAKFESLDKSMAQVILTRSGSVTLRNRTNTATLLSSNPTDSFTEAVSAFDGTIDFLGTSGRTFPALLISQTTSTSTTAPADLALFTGPAGNPGNVSLPVVGAGTSVAAGPGNIVSQFNTRAGGTVTVCYYYQLDCNGNGIPDFQDILNGAVDLYGPGTCAPDGVPDSCQPEPDCDNDGLPNRCELAGNDCDGNGFPDNCQPDCDGDMIADACEILGGAPDRYGRGTCTPDGIPDSCQPTLDCDMDGLPDRCELRNNDCDANGFPDNCQPDCDGDGIADVCELLLGAPDRYGPGTCAPDGIPDNCQPELDCDNDGLPNRCELTNNDCDANGFPDNCQPDCDLDGIADVCELLLGAPDRYGPGTCAPDGIPDNCQPELDCDNDGLPNRCELTNNDCDANGFPDNCQPDCDLDGIADVCELLLGAPDRYGPGTCAPDGIPDNCQPELDCDNDGLPNRCELTNNDCDANGFPDNCQPDCDLDGIADVCELLLGAPDRYGPGTCAPDGIPDNCQPELDCDNDGLPNRCELTNNDCDANGFPDNCQPDCDLDGIADVCELLLGAPDRYGPGTCAPDGIPDNCQPELDCDNDGLPNRCELTNNDCDANGFPDNCQPDCDLDGIADVCELLLGAPDRYGPGTCAPDGIPDNCQPELDCDNDGLPNRCELANNDCDANGFPDNCQPDCDGDGIADVCELLLGAPDRYGPGTCAPDGIPDNCQPELDCDNDGLPNRCELTNNDCDANGFPDNCQPDCDLDGIADVCELLLGAPDRYGPGTCAPDGIPDNCQPELDCDNDGLPNRCELANNDCDANGFPDNCQPDCDGDGIADVCELLLGAPDRYGPGTCAPDGIPDNCQPELDCDNDGLPNRCELTNNDCDANGFPDNCQPDCDNDGTADVCELLLGAPDRYGPGTCAPDGIPDNCQPELDCDNDGLPNRCELTNNDCDANGFPDNCQPDCDNDGTADVCEILLGAPDRYGPGTCAPDGIPDNCQPELDCDNDGLPNRCELANNDCDANGFPDNCQPDCDLDGIADVCELLLGAPDRYGPGTCAPDGIPDNCQPELDCDNDGLPNRCELTNNDCDANGFPDNCQPDCDLDGIADVCELLLGAPDRYGPGTCAPDGIPDNCQPELDCDNDGLPNRCELANNDCDANGFPDNCQPDCDLDGIADVCELLLGAPDRYGPGTCAPDGIPDNCQPELDCDNDGLPNRCELTNNDCDANGFPDNCQPDCDNDGTADVCEILLGAPDRYGPGTCAPDGIPDNCQPELDCDNDGLPNRCELANNDCDANGFPDNCQPDCDNDGIADVCEILLGAPDRYGRGTCAPDGIPDSCQPALDCDMDGLPDRCELRNNDCDANGVPDNCQPDCDFDGIPDICEIAAGAPDTHGIGTCTPDGVPDSCQPEPDCNLNHIADRCEIAAGASDCDHDGVLDACEPDCNGDGTIDDCEVDCNNDNIPDECQPLVDCDANAIPDVCELAGHDCNANGVLDACEPDCNANGIPDACDIASNPQSDMDNDGIPDVCQCVERNRREPGSLLLFPKYDNRQAVRTLVTITNVHPSQHVDVHIVYRGQPNCLENDFTERLTAKDTFTFRTDVLNPSNDQGYIYAYAKDPRTGAPISFNHLIGESLALLGIGTFDYALSAVSFRGVGADGTPTDVDLDGRRDLDALEYEEAPAEILIPRFLGQTLQSASDLVLIDLSGGPAFTTLVDLTVYNDNEEPFSVEHAFRCWTCLPLSQLDGVFDNDFLGALGSNDPDEIGGLGTQESGWIRINGDIGFSAFVEIPDPAIYAVLIERRGGRVAADLPFELCSQRNGSLLPIGPAGD